MGSSAPSSPAPPAPRFAATGLDRATEPTPYGSRSRQPGSQASWSVGTRSGDDQLVGNISDEATHAVILIVALQKPDHVAKTRSILQPRQGRLQARSTPVSGSRPQAS